MMGFRVVFSAFEIAKVQKIINIEILFLSLQNEKP